MAAGKRRSALLPASVAIRIIGASQPGASMARVPARATPVERLLAEARRPPPAPPRRLRILFALDATASREPTWDLAMNLHAELFQAAAGTGVAVQLVYYRGWREFHVSPWSDVPADLLRRMTGVACRGGLTQIQRVLEHGLREAQRERIQAAVFVGDALGRHSRAYWGAYAVSKSGIEGLASVLAEEVESAGTPRVVCVDPGPMRTGLRRSAFPAEPPDAAPEPDAVAGGVLFALDPTAPIVHGASVNIG